MFLNDPFENLMKFAKLFKSFLKQTIEWKSFYENFEQTTSR